MPKAKRRKAKKRLLDRDGFSLRSPPPRARFIQIAVRTAISSNGLDSPALYGLSDQGAVWRFDNNQSRWIPMSMEIL